MFQNPDQQIFAASAYDEVAFAPRNAGLAEDDVARRVQRVLAAVGLDDCGAGDPFLLGKGQRQRLAVASLLALEPALLILDEPTTGLDYAEQRRMMQRLAALHAGGLTLIIITHTPWVVAEYAQRGVVLSEGRVAFDGPLRALFAEEALLGVRPLPSPRRHPHRPRPGFHGAVGGRVAGRRLRRRRRVKSLRVT